MAFSGVAGDRLLKALAFSLAAHAALLFTSDARRPTEPPRTPVIAVLAVEKASAPQPPAVAPWEQKPLPKENPRRAPLTRAPNPPTANESSATIAEPIAMTSPTQATPAAEQPRATTQAEARPPEEDPDGVRQFRLALAREARRYRHYPVRARERGLTGTAEVILSYGTAELPEIMIGRSSGYEILDRQALTTLSQAAASAPLPDRLRGHAIKISVPVSFSLED